MRKLKVTKFLAIGLGFFTISVLFQTLGTYINYYLEYEYNVDVLFAFSHNWVLIWFIFLIDQFQISQLCTILGTYAIFKLSSEVFFQKPKKYLNGLHFLLISFAIIGYIFVRPFLIEVPYFIDISYFLVGYVIFVFLPLLIGAVKLLNRIEKNTENYSNIQALVYLAVSFIFSMIALALETAFPGRINFFSFLGWFFITTALIFSYHGFFRVNRI